MLEERGDSVPGHAGYISSLPHGLGMAGIETLPGSSQHDGCRTELLWRGAMSRHHSRGSAEHSQLEGRTRTSCVRASPASWFQSWLESPQLAIAAVAKGSPLQGMHGPTCVPTYCCAVRCAMRCVSSGFGLGIDPDSPH